jgi:hypothetical protein
MNSAHRKSLFAGALTLGVASCCLMFGFAPADSSAADLSETDAIGEFRPMFAADSFEGWVRVNTAPSTWQFKDGLLVCSGKPIGELRTTRMYQNFILELEWRHMVPGGNAGVFVWADDITARGVPFHRGIEVQVLDHGYGNTEHYTTHGDIFPIHGATMTPVNGRGGSRAFPAELRSKPSPEWNHYRIECRDGEISLAVNGKVVTRGTECSPRKGYICLESEGGVVHYRNVRIQELPDTPIDAKDIAIAHRGYQCLYLGLDLENWKTDGDEWHANDWVLSYRGQSAGRLQTKQQFEDLGFLFDLRPSKAGQAPQVTIRDVNVLDAETLAKLPAGEWARVEGELRNGRLSVSVNGQPVVEDRPVTPVASGPLALLATGPVDFANLYARP